MNQQQLINQIETKITEIQTDIQHWKKQTNTYESTLLALIEELTQIKENMKNKQNNQNSPKGSNNIK